jgi:hypothetical protein
MAQQNLDEQVKALIEQIKRKANLKFDATTPQLAVDTEARQLQRLFKPTIAVSIAEDGADVLADQQLNKDANFSNLRFTFSGQLAGASLDYAASMPVPALGAVDVSARLRAQLAPAVELATDHATAEFRTRFAVTSLDVTGLKLSRNGQPLPSFTNDLVDALIRGLLVPAQALLNRTEFRIPTMIAAKLDLQPSKKEGVAIEFDPKTVTPKLRIVAAAFLLDRGRLTVMAQDAGAANNVPVEPSNVSFETFRDNFLKLLDSIGAIHLHQGQFAAYVESGIIERLTSDILATSPVCMRATVADLPVPIHEKATLPPESSIDCTPTRDCTPTKDCSQSVDCAQRAACGEVCTLRAPITGHCITHGHDIGCEAGKAARKLACEVEKERRRVQCEADKAVNKASCEALKTSEKDSCEGLKEAYKHLRGTGPDYANIDSTDLRLNGSAHVCLNEIKLETKALRLTGKLDAEGAATATGKITFTPLNVVGHATCFAPFDYNLSEKVRVVPQPIDIDTAAQLQTDTSSIAVNATITNPVHLRFPFRAIAEKLAADPKFQIFCPIPGVATNLRVLTPDSWWPKVARGDIDKDFPGFSFNLDLFSKPIDLGELPLTGKLQRTEKGIEGVFAVAGSPRPH